jgi:hypothetical protein
MNNEQLQAKVAHTTESAAMTPSSRIRAASRVQPTEAQRRNAGTNE